MASSEPIMLPPVAGCDNNGGGGDEGGADFQFIDFDECSLEDRTNLCRILDVSDASAEEQGRHLNCHCEFKLPFCFFENEIDVYLQNYIR